MKIIHLSDLHLCKSFKKGNIIKTKRILKYLAGEEFDHLVITGDITDNSNIADLLLFRKMLQKYGLLDPERVSVTIGNHDIFGGVQMAYDIVNFPSKCLSTDYNRKVNEFVEIFRELFEGAYFPLKNSFFPFAKKIGDILVVGLNTVDVYSRLKNPFASNGKVKPEEFEALKEIFAKKDFAPLKKIVLTHHHFYKNSIEATSSSPTWNRLENITLKLRGKKRLIKLFMGNNVEAVFHGHSHEMKEYFRKKIKFVNGGACVDNRHDTKAHLTIFHLDNEGSRSEIKTFHKPVREYRLPFVPARYEKETAEAV